MRNNVAFGDPVLLGKFEDLVAVYVSSEQTDIYYNVELTFSKPLCSKFNLLNYFYNHT